MCKTADSATKGRLFNQDIINYVYGGDATFTLENTATLKHYTFKVVSVEQKDANKNPIKNTVACYFVYAMTGPSNENSFTFVGTLFPNSKFVYRHSTKSRIQDMACVTMKSLQWLFNRMDNFNSGNLTKLLPEGMAFWHNGYCSMCSRKLTTPASLSAGIGPICSARLVDPTRVRKSRIGKILADLD